MAQAPKLPGFPRVRAGRAEEVQTYTREQAIAELISALKVHEKIASIRKFIKQLPKDETIG